MKKFLFLIILIPFFLKSQDIKDTVNLETIEIESIRIDKSTPITKFLITEKQKEFNYYSQEVPVLLSISPNITYYSDGGGYQGYTYFRLRGIDQTRINMTLNGIPLNEPEDQGVYFSNFPDFSKSMESIQIQRGIGTSSNGVSSYGGSINFESKQGFEPYTNMDIGYGSFDTYRFDIENSTGLSKNKTSFYSRYSNMGTDGYKYHSGSKGQSFFLNGGYYGDKNILKTIIFSGVSENELAWIPVDQYDILIDPRTNYNTNRENDRFKQNLVSLIYIRKLDKYSNITTTLYYNRLNGYWDLDLLNYGIDTVQRYGFSHDFYGLISNYNYEKNNTKLNIGIHINEFNRTHYSNILPNTDSVYTNIGHKPERSGFVKIQQKVNKFILFGDIQMRYTTFEYDGDILIDKMYWTFLNYRFGTRYITNSKSSIYINIGKSYREPTRTNIFGGIENPSYFDVNYDISPESVVDIETGLDYHSRLFEINTNLYYMKFKNEITFIGILGEDALPLMDNVDNSFRSGIEMDMVYYLFKSTEQTVKYRNNVAYSYNRIKENNREFQPLYTPNFIMNNQLIFDIKNSSFLIENLFRNGSYMDWENKTKLPSYFVFNFQFGYKFNNNIEMLFRYNNMTDETYFTNGEVNDNNIYLFVNPPRNWFITFKLNL